MITYKRVIRNQGSSIYFMTVETDRRERCGLTETLVESGYEAA